MGSETPMKIGCHCPYAWVPLAELKGVEPVWISWEDAGYANLGSTKLCKKLTSVLNAVFQRMLDGLVMTHCCELSVVVYHHLLVEYPHFPVYLMNQPTKPRADFNDLIFREWDEIKEKFNQAPGARGRDEGRSDFHKFLIHQGNEGEDHWCRLPGSIMERLQTIRQAERVSLLRNNVLCPRMSFDQGEDPRIHSGGAGVFSTIEDPECLAQDYWSLYTRELMRKKTDE